MDLAVATNPEMHPADDPRRRAEQRGRLRELREELLAEGADGSALLPELMARADTWPE